VQASHNTKQFRFEIPNNKCIGLGIGRHVSIRAFINDNNVMRAYTPTSHPNQNGYFELLIKSYEMGKMSPYLHSLEVGALVDIRGPVGRFKYKPNMYNKMGFIAGGTGLTPCLQVIRCILSEDYSDDKTELVLFYQNRTEGDILLKKTLNELAVANPSRFQIIYFLSNPSTPAFGQEANNERRGYISINVLHEYMNSTVCPHVNEDSLLYVFTTILTSLASIGKSLWPLRI
jgi:cytochrome-b5 reductase